MIVLVEDDGRARVVAAGDADVKPLEAIDPTRSAARVRTQGGDELPGDVAAAWTGRWWRSARSSWACATGRSR